MRVLPEIFSKFSCSSRIQAVINYPDVSDISIAGVEHWRVLVRAWFLG
jgi:hypothetical protein